MCSSHDGYNLKFRIEKRMVEIEVENGLLSQRLILIGEQPMAMIPSEKEKEVSIVSIS